MAIYASENSKIFDVFGESIVNIIFALVALFCLLCAILVFIVCCYKKHKIVKKDTLGKEHTDIEFNKVTSVSSVGLSSMNSDDNAVIGSRRSCVHCGFVISKSSKFCSECGRLQNKKNNIVNINDVNDANMDKQLQTNTGIVQKREHANSELMYMNDNINTIAPKDDSDDISSDSSERYEMNQVETIVDSLDIKEKFTSEGVRNY